MYPLFIRLILVGALAWLSASPAMATIGTVQFAFGDVRITGVAGERAASKGSAVLEGERVMTGPASSAQLKMIDGAFVAVRPGTEIGFDEYKFSGKEDGSERGVISLIRGGFRSITGLIGRANRLNYTVRTPTSTVGIRGTDKEVIVILPPLPGVALPSGSLPGTYAKVNVGAAYIRTQVSTVNIAPNQVGFAGAANQSPQLLPRVPDLFRANPPPSRAQAPAGGPQQGQQQAQQGGQQGGQSAGQGAQQGGQQASSGGAGGGGGAAQSTGGGTGTGGGGAAGTSAPAEPIRTVTAADSPGQLASSGGGAAQSTGGGTGTGGGGAAGTSAPAEPIRTVTAVDSPGQLAAVVSQVATAPPATSTAAASASVASLSAPTSTAGSTGSTGTSGSSSSGSSASTQAVVPVTLTSNSGVTVDVTSSTAKSSSGATIALTQGSTSALTGSAAFTTNLLRHVLFYPVLSSGNLVYGVVNSVPATDPVYPKSDMTSANYLFDVNGNLARVLETPYGLFLKGSVPSSYPTSIPVPSTTANTGHATDESFSGGTGMENVGGPTLGVRFGRYQGGQVNITDTVTNQTYVDVLGARSALWAVYQRPTWATGGATVTPNLTGSWQYLRPGDATGNGFATAPADTYGNTGTVLGAGLTVNFTNMTVNPSVSVSLTRTGIGGANGATIFSGYAQNVALNNMAGFNVGSADLNPLRVSCSGSGCINTQTYGGRIIGSLTGDTSQGAFFRYTFNPNFSTVAQATAANHYMDDLVSGMIAFQRGAQFVAPAVSATPAQVLLSYNSMDARIDQYSISDATDETFTNGNLTSVKQVDVIGGNTSKRQLTIAVGTGTIADAQPTSAATNGISYGRYSNSPALQLSVLDSNGTLTNRFVNNSGLQWISGPALYPFYASAILNSPTSANYAFDGATRPTDQNGALGTLNSATMSVNFLSQTVNLSLNASTSAGTWAAFTPSPLRLDDSGGFFGNAGVQAGTVNGVNQSNVNNTTHNSLTATFTPTASSAQDAIGKASGQLTGPGANGAILAYNFAASGQSINGTAAFNGTSQPTLDTYRAVISARGMAPNGNVIEELNYRTTGGASAETRNGFANGFLAKWDSITAATVQPTGCGTCTPYKADIPVSVAASPIFNSVVTTSGINQVILDNVGSDATTGITWGRYGGALALTDRANLATLPASTAAYGTAGSTNAQSLLHVIYGPTQSGPTILPLTGTANFALTGNTNPTDNLGNSGVLNSASVNVDFTNKAVTALSVNATANGVNWTATNTANLPIQSNTYFGAQKTLSGASSTLQVTRAGSTVNTAGQILGVFTGTSGTGAMITYSLYNNPNGTTTNQTGASSITGVAAFKR